MIAVISFADSDDVISWLALRSPISNTRFDFIGHKSNGTDDPTVRLMYDCGDGPVDEEMAETVRMNVGMILWSDSTEVTLYEKRDDLPAELQECL